MLDGQRHDAEQDRRRATRRQISLCTTFCEIHTLPDERDAKEQKDD